jgi:amino acid transporter
MEMDFGPAQEFDEQDIINAIASQDSERNTEKSKQTTWIKRAQYMVFG